MNTQFSFSAGVWNLSTGADPFGPPVRPEREIAEKLRIFKDLGFDFVQLHDDDAVPMDVPAAQLEESARSLKRLCDDHGLKVEFVAPRIWEDPDFSDGGMTANSRVFRHKGLERARRSIEIMRILDTDRLVLWPAREGTYIREAKDAVQAFDFFLDYLNHILSYDQRVRILAEMKPNEPMDMMYLPSTGHMLAMAQRTNDPGRVGVLIESAHCILLGLDPADEMAYALWHRKLWGVHLNDQNGLKYDQDKVFGSVDIRRAFNQVYVLERCSFGRRDEIIGLDVKAMRTTKPAQRTQHLTNSRDVFLRLVDLVRSLDHQKIDDFRANRDYEGL